MYEISKPLNEEDAQFLLPTEFCDSEDPRIVELATEITEGAESETEAAIMLFDWVKDHLTYRLGLYKDLASATIEKAGGSCSNKANVFVALSRSIGIPAGFHVSRVKTREYFGPLCTPRFKKFVSLQSYHVYAGVKLNGKWIKVDPTDDSSLSDGVKHIAPQAKPVFFDGKNDARLNLNKDHIINDTKYCLTSIDNILSKQVRVSDVAVEVYNIYLDHMRNHGARHNSVQSIVEEFFEHLVDSFPDKYHAFIRLERALEQKVAS